MHEPKCPREDKGDAKFLVGKVSKSWKFAHIKNLNIMNKKKLVVKKNNSWNDGIVSKPSIDIITNKY